MTITEFIVKTISSPVYADRLGDAIADNVTEASQAQDVEGLVESLIQVAVPAGVLAAIGLMVYAGFLMVTSQGNPEKLNEAREVITNTLIGFALIALSVAILLLITNTLNLPITP